MPFYDYECAHCGVFEIYQNINDDIYKSCPKCKSKSIKRLISNITSFINKNRQANMYNDVKGSKYWRDKNGIRHRVTKADGCSTSPTVSNKITASQEMVDTRINKDKKATEKRLSKIRHGFFKKK